MSLYHEIYDKAYEKITPDWLDDSAGVERFLAENTKTMVDFFEAYSEQFGVPEKGLANSRVLVCGCGLGGMALYFASRGAEVTGIDVSPLAIMNAKHIASAKGLDIDFREADVASTQETLGEFDIVFDAHLLHCLTSKADRASYLEFVKRHLSDGAHFMLETMVFHKMIRTPVGYSLDQDFTLWKETNEGEVPVRKIINGMELEEEIKTAGLQIGYLYFHAELSFEIFDDYEDYPHQNLPQTARLVAKK